MLEKITGVEIKGGRFTDWTPMDNILSYPFNILYGTNGSGKSTLARALSDYGKSDAEKTYTHLQTAMLPNDDIVETDRFDVHVFNEDFINNEMRIVEDDNSDNSSLNTIVMFGRQISANTNVDGLKQQIKKFEDDISIQNTTVTGNNAADKREALLKLLRQSDDLADKVQQCRCNGSKMQRNTVAGFIDEIIQKRNAYSYGDISTLLPSLNEEIDKIQASSGNSTYTWLHDQAVLSFDLGKLVLLLSKVIQEPTLSKRDELLIDMTEAMMTESREKMSHLSVSRRCPVCRQVVDETHRQRLITAINNVLNKEVENFVADLENALENIKDFKEYPFDMSGNYTTEINAYKIAIGNANKKLATIRDIINDRIKTPFVVTSTIDVADVNKAIAVLDAAIKVLEQKVNDFNKVVNSLRDTKKFAEDTAKQIAYLKYKKEFDEIADMDDACETARDKIKNDEGQIRQLQQQLKNALAAQKSTTVAMEFINDCLYFVFADSSHLYLEAGDGCYKVMVDGHPVDIRNVSTGERNIMALAYFFATLFADRNEDDKYRNEMLVVIDDPISSFDHNNRAGVMSLLREQISNIVMGNKNSKVLLISHDQLVASSMQTIYKQSIANERNYKLFRGNIQDKDIWQYTPDIFLLQNGKVSTIEAKSEYKEYLMTIYEFAKADKENLDDFKNMQLGNTMRQVLESYANMMYGMSYTELLKVGILKKYLQITDQEELKKAANFYSSGLSRFLLNSMSHADTGVIEPMRKQFTVFDLHPTARKMLLMMKQTNEAHLRSFLRSKNGEQWADINRKLDQWKQEMMR